MIGPKDFSQKNFRDPFLGVRNIRAYLPMDLFDPALYEMSEGFLIMRVQYDNNNYCLLYTSPSPRDKRQSRMPSSA